MGAPLISVIIPCFDYEQWVGAAVRSALAQDWPAIEVIAVDDGSTDGTPEVLASFGDAIRVIRRPNGGLNAATSTGFEAATGEFITLLDADDEWQPDRCRLLAEALIATPEAGLAYGDMEVIDTEGTVIVESFREGFKLPVADGNVLGDLLSGNVISAGALMVRASLRERFHPIPEHAAWQDWWIASRVAEVAGVVAIDAPVNRYRHHEANMNLGQHGARFVEICRTEAPFRRWLLTTVDPGLVSPRDLFLGVANYDHHLRKIAEADGSTVDDVVAPTAEDRAKADELIREGLRVLAADGPAAAMAPITRAAALVPSSLEARVLLDDLLLTAEGPVEPAPEPRRIAVAVSAPDALDKRGLLAAWARAFSGDDDVTLVVVGLRQRVDDLIAAAARHGLDQPDAADVVTLEERHPAAVAARLGRETDAVVTSAAEVDALAAALRRRSAVTA
jgi:glycosyltransferase involved in cell wall biosynthesis